MNAKNKCKTLNDLRLGLRNTRAPRTGATSIWISSLTVISSAASNGSKIFSSLPSVLQTFPITLLVYIISFLSIKKLRLEQSQEYIILLRRLLIFVFTQSFCGQIPVNFNLSSLRPRFYPNVLCIISNRKNPKKPITYPAQISLPQAKTVRKNKFVGL